MEPTKNNSRRALLLWSTPIVVGHFIAVVWHLLLVLKLPSVERRYAEGYAAMASVTCICDRRHIFLLIRE
jgi:hypothetical protein